MDAMKIAAIDISIIAVYMLAIFVVGIWRTRKAAMNVDSFFLKNRTTSWWVAGISMAAANFSIDTPLAITNFIYQQGICGVWFYWSGAILAIVTAFIFARLWRRSAVVTDAEITEIRYSGKSAAALRLFKGFYFGIVLNVFILGWGFLAFMKVFSVVADLNPAYAFAVSIIIALLYTVFSGFYGAVYTSVLQYIIALTGAFLLAFYSVLRVGGLASLKNSLNTTSNINRHLIRFFPDFQADSIDSTIIFLTCVLVIWWGQKYSDGGGKNIQRILSTKNEKHAVKASLLSSLLVYVLQIWPWIITALCSIIIFPNIKDPEMGYVYMLTQSLPAGIYGLVLASLIAAFMATVSTHLNLGASYMINDIYRRFICKNGSDRHYVWISRFMVIILLLASIAAALNMKSIAWAWTFLVTFVSGAGLTWVLRWFWWRVNAWSEISALIVSGITALCLEILHPEWLYAIKLLIVVGITTVAWVIITFLTSPSNEQTLVNFVSRIRPGSSGWNYIYRKYNITPVPFLGQSLILCVVGILFIFTLCFSVGNILLLSWGDGVVLLLFSVLLMFYLRRQLKIYLK
jgi:Na+/proline symporter